MGARQYSHPPRAANKALGNQEATSLSPCSPMGDHEGNAMEAAQTEMTFDANTNVKPIRMAENKCKPVPPLMRRAAMDTPMNVRTKMAKGVEVRS